MDYSKEFLTSWLKDSSSHKADIVTIMGMGGIGKTTLAKYVYGLHSHEFATSSFIEDISRPSNKRSGGLLALQKQLYDDISTSKSSSTQVHDVFTYISMIENVVARKKVFIVLDDIDRLEQLDALLGSKGFHTGSKIIITTKDAWLIQSCAMFKTNLKPKHEKHLLNGLYEIESRELLCFHAFICNYPKVGFEEVLEKLVKYCEGHPLALEVLGKSLHNRDVAYWEGYIEGLKKEMGSNINNVLRMSFDTLSSNDKELFKHIACFFVGMDRDVTQTILKACDIETRSGITNLTDRCLLSIGWSNKLMMHQLLQEMGKFEVHKESPQKPWEQSRLWCHEESFKVLKQKKGTENVLGLTLDMRMLEKEKLCGPFEVKTDALSMMDNLMLLQLNYVQIRGSYENFPEQLRWLVMHGFPLKSIPSKLPMKNLVSLDMSYSNIESFGVCYSNTQRLQNWQKWLFESCSKDKRLLGTLKILNLSFCEKLSSLGGFEELPLLEKLIVTNCIGLVKVCESIEACVKLVLIDLRYCSKLEKLPKTIGMLKKVKTLLLDGCNLCESHIEIRNTDSLKMLKGNSIGINTKTSSSSVLEAIPSYRKFFATFIPISLACLSLSTPDFTIDWESLEPSSFEFEGVIKIQPMAGVAERVLGSLGWTNLDFLNGRQVRTNFYFRESEESQIQVVVFGRCIMNLAYSAQFMGGKQMPNWIHCRSKGPSISFTIPSSPYNFRGLNFCYVPGYLFPNQFVDLPIIKVSNLTKNGTWIYRHYIDGASVGGQARSLTLLSHWMFGMNEMEAGDHVTITVTETYNQLTKECGVSLVYDDGNMDEDEDGDKGEDEEEDVLGYYKSWNHIIGGDLTGFQLTSGEYILDAWQFMRNSAELRVDRYHPFITGGASFKGRDPSS
ncbi:unnamed protein product [Lactuca saligna]|uniref:ADP-ribosyl cyclase/cyclic ADP-ribose hydrolase n=1 Tax=Lactuca saligna TaxID=75948 RepID=A0AA35VMA8_LACSI|nr:unnamed protein product [Lactuca saligna]